MHEGADTSPKPFFSQTGCHEWCVREAKKRGNVLGPRGLRELSIKFEEEYKLNRQGKKMVTNQAEKSQRQRGVGAHGVFMKRGLQERGAGRGNGGKARLLHATLCGSEAICPGARISGSAISTPPFRILWVPS